MAWRAVTNPFDPVRVLSDDQVEHIHLSSLRLLAGTGMRVLHADARAVLAAAGCEVDDLVVRFDPDLITEVVAHAPSEFTLRARNPARDLVIGGNNVVFGSIGGPAFASDIERGRRPGTLAEQVEYLSLIQQLGVLHHEGGGPFEPMDLPPETRHLDVCHSLIRHLDKNWQGILLGRERAADCIDMVAIALATDRDGLARQPALLGIANTNTPLTLDVPMAEGIIEFASAGQAVCITPFTLAGAMAPVTLAGALTLQHAEALAGIALTQAVRPGAPVVYGAFTSNVDMKSGAPAFGTPEYFKAALASGQLARHVGLPYRSSAPNASNAPDAQAMYETMMSLFGAVLGGCNLLLHCAGWLEGGLTASKEKFILDIEVLQMLAESFQPIVVDADEIGLDAIAETSPGGHFFGGAHTLARYRTAFYEPLVSDWANFGQWTEEGSRDATQRANEIWKQILAEFQPPPIDDAIAEELDEFAARRTAEGGAPPES